MNQLALKEDGRQARRKSPEVFKQEFHARVGDDFTLLSDYEKSTVPVYIRHNECGYEFKMLPSAFMCRPACRHCANMRARIAPEAFQERFDQIHQGEFELVTPYEVSSKKVKVKHVACGGILEMLPRIALERPYCHPCKQLERCNGDEFANMIYVEIGVDFKVIQSVKDLTEQARLKHLKCGHEFDVEAYQFLSNPMCPHCSHEVHPKTLTNEKFQTRLNQLYPGSFSLVGNYRGSGNRVALQHLPCGSISHPWVSNLSRGTYKCPTCKS